MPFKFPEEHRITEGGPMASTSLEKSNGLFLIPMKIKIPTGHNKAPREVRYYLSCLCTTYMAWESILVSCLNEAIKTIPRSPTNEELMHVKEKFWGPDVDVMQLFPSEKTDMQAPPATALLWRPMFSILPVPPADYKTWPECNKLNLNLHKL